MIYKNFIFSIWSLRMKLLIFNTDVFYFITKIFKKIHILYSVQCTCVHVYNGQHWDPKKWPSLTSGCYSKVTFEVKGYVAPQIGGHYKQVVAIQSGCYSEVVGHWLVFDCIFQLPHIGKDRSLWITLKYRHFNSLLLDMVLERSRLSASSRGSLSSTSSSRTLRPTN